MFPNTFSSIFCISLALIFIYCRDNSVLAKECISSARSSHIKQDKVASFPVPPSRHSQHPTTRRITYVSQKASLNILRTKHTQIQPCPLKVLAQGDMRSIKLGSSTKLIMSGA